MTRRDAGGNCEELFGETFQSARSHNALIFAPLGRALDFLGSQRPDLVVVGTGPGSYTGIRIGIAAAHGVATGLGVRWTGWNSLCTLDDASRFHVVGDARRGGFYHAVVDGGRITGEPDIHPLAELGEFINGLDAPVFTTDERPLVPGIEARVPQAARLAAWVDCNDLPTSPVEPVYLRAPYITTPRQA